MLPVLIGALAIPTTIAWGWPVGVAVGGIGLVLLLAFLLSRPKL